MARGLDDFAGRFQLRRRIEDARSGAVIRFEGEAELRPDGSGLSYAETGQLIQPTGARFHAERRYLWRADDSVPGSKISVLFDDGRAFHDFDPTRGGEATEHLCGEDLYKGGYRFEDWPVWTATWLVSGPRKSYQSVTHYHPC